MATVRLNQADPGTWTAATVVDAALADNEAVALESRVIEQELRRADRATVMRYAEQRQALGLFLAPGPGEVNPEVWREVWERMAQPELAALKLSVHETLGLLALVTAAPLALPRVHAPGTEAITAVQGPRPSLARRVEAEAEETGVTNKKPAPAPAPMASVSVSPPIVPQRFDVPDGNPSVDFTDRHVEQLLRHASEVRASEWWKEPVFNLSIARRLEILGCYQLTVDGTDFARAAHDATTGAMPDVPMDQRMLFALLPPTLMVRLVCEGLCEEMLKRRVAEAYDQDEQ